MSQPHRNRVGAAGIALLTMAALMPVVIGSVIHPAAAAASPAVVSATQLTQGKPTGVSCGSTTFCVAVDDSGHAITFTGTSWAAPVAIDGANDIQAVSCPSTSFCAAVDGTGNAVRYNGATWTVDAAIDPGAAGLQTGDLATTRTGITAVSCPSSTFCMAVDAAGNAVSFNGAGWSTPTSVDGTTPLSTVSCPTSSFCVAGDGTHAFVFNGGAWSTAPITGGTRTLSCPSVTFCAGDDIAGDTAEWNGSTWSSTALPSLAVITGGISAEMVCTSSTNCWAWQSGVGGAAAVNFNGTAWTTTPAFGEFTAMACTPTGSCLAVNTDGLSATVGGTTWSAPTFVEASGPLAAVSCGTATACVAVTAPGMAFTWNGSSWSSPTALRAASVNSSVTALSCVGPTVCVAMDATDSSILVPPTHPAGNAYLYNGTSWSATSVDATASLGSVSCATTTFCVATNTTGAFVFNGSGWSAAVSGVVGAVTCATSTMCVTTGGQVLTGSTWSTITAPAAVGIACAAATSCVGVGPAQSATGPLLTTSAQTFNGSTWSAPATLPTALALVSVACPSTTFCAAVDGNVAASTVVATTGDIATFDGSTWTATTQLEPASAFVGLSCPAATGCTAVDTLGRAVAITFGSVGSASATTTTITPTANPSKSSTPTLFRLTVAASGTAAGTPTGEVAVQAGTSIGYVPLANGVAFVSALLPTGTFTITATYAGDQSFAPSSATSTQVVDGPGTAPTLTSVVPGANPITGSQTITFGAFVAPVSGTAAPTGNVDLFVDGAKATTIAANSVGTTFTGGLAPFTSGSHTVKAVYYGDTLYAGSSSTTLTMVVATGGVRPTTTTLSPSVDPVTQGQPVTFTATVTPASGTGTPTGSVTFVVNFAVVGTVPLVNGSATFTSTRFGAGFTSVDATYWGDATFAGSAATTLSEGVNAGGGTTGSQLVVNASANPVASATTVMFTATVSPVSGPGVPTGYITFLVDNLPGVPIAVAAGSATLSLSTLAPGAHTISASYQGDSTFVATASNNLTEVVLAPTTQATTVTVQSSANPSVLGDAVTFTASVAPTTGPGTPTGTVTFAVDGSAQSPVPLTGGQAQLVTSSLAVGPHTIAASYSGDGTYAPATATALDQTVTAPATTTTTSVAPTTTSTTLPSTTTTTSLRPSTTTTLPATTTTLPATTTTLAATTTTQPPSTTTTSTTLPSTTTTTLGTTTTQPPSTTTTTLGTTTTLAATTSTALASTSTSTPTHPKPGRAPKFTSSHSVRFLAGTGGTFTVTVTGYPVPAIGGPAHLERGIELIDHRDGTATLTVESFVSPGTYRLALVASNGVRPDARQHLVVKVIGRRPHFRSGPSVVLLGGRAEAFTVRVTGSPHPSLSATGLVPPGFLLLDNGDGTATLEVSTYTTSGSYRIVVTADNGVGRPTHQWLKVTIRDQPPVA